MNYSIVIQKEAHKIAFESSLDIIFWGGYKSLKQIHYHVLMNYYKTEKNLKTSIFAIEKCLLPNKAELIASINESILTTRYKIRDLQFSQDDTVDDEDLDPWECIADTEEIHKIEVYETRRAQKMRIQREMEMKKDFERQMRVGTWC
jgi:hypothetical protein